MQLNEPLINVKFKNLQLLHSYLMSSLPSYQTRSKQISRKQQRTISQTSSVSWLQLQDLYFILIISVSFLFPFPLLPLTSFYHIITSFSNLILSFSNVILLNAFTFLHFLWIFLNLYRFLFNVLFFLLSSLWIHHMHLSVSRVLIMSASHLLHIHEAWCCQDYFTNS